MKLIFVYNASDRYFSKFSDFAHKLVSPETYPCSLCNITYGNVSMKREWKSYLNQLDLEVQFLYKNKINTLNKRLPIDPPVVLIKYPDNRIKVLLSAYEIDDAKNVEQLIKKIDNKLIIHRGI